MGIFICRYRLNLFDALQRNKLSNDDVRWMSIEILDVSSGCMALCIAM
jgi:hypothetical protein